MLCFYNGKTRKELRMKEKGRIPLREEVHGLPQTTVVNLMLRQQRAGACVEWVVLVDFGCATLCEPPSLSHINL